MKVFTFFYDRFDRATTSNALHNNFIEHFVLVHSAEDLKKFKSGNNVIHGKEIITNNPKGLAHQRNSALEMMDDGEWAVFMSDDFIKVKSYPKEFILSKTNKMDITYENQTKFDIRKQKDMSLKEMFSMFPKLIDIAEANNVHLIGFSGYDNPRVLRNKFTTRGIADGRFWLVKKSTYNFDIRAQMIDDYYWTAENLVRHGNVLVLNWCLPDFSRYTAGGYGSEEQRKKEKKKACSFLVDRYNPLLNYADKAGYEKNGHIKLNASNNNILAARRNLGML